MIRFLLFTWMAALLSTLALAQPPTDVWTKTFTFGGNYDVPQDLLVYGGNIFVNGYYHQVDGTSSIIKGAAAGFLPNGEMDWAILDSNVNASMSNSMAATSKAFFVVYGNVMIKRLNSGTIDWRETIGSMLLFITSYGEDTVVAIEQGNNSRALMVSDEGNVARTLPIAETAVGQITPVVKGDRLWVSANYYGGDPLDGFVAMFDIPSGKLMWRKNFQKSVRGFMAVDDSGNAYYVASLLQSDGDGTLKMLRVKLDTTGAEVWREEWYPRDTQPANYENWVNGVTVDKSWLVVGGTIQKGDAHTGDKSAYLAQFNVSNGNQNWEKHWEYTPQAIISQVGSLKFDSEGDLIVVGNTFTDPTGKGNPPNLGYLQKYLVPGLLRLKERRDMTPNGFSLSQNYPNPFNPTTAIRFEVSRESFVKLVVYNTLGQEVKILVNGLRSAGIYEFSFNASDLSSGFYFYCLTANDFNQTRKMLYVK